ncbi:IniB N-terminal domain-containing protein [Actinoplanes sp. NPDC023801]|uniref:IniB N-terminal domain-containing protein n=1 Tax=Actinoplanes sp. NPDC023801 TaxID=3154595 RepID=UPI0033EAC0A8
MTSPTLQDFVLNLIYDPAARSAFELDPEATLRHAGLDDITATDVQQVLPLVIDSAPVAGLTGPDGLDDLTTGVASLDVAGAVAQLQAIAAHVTPHDAVEVNATSSVNVTVLGLDADGLAQVSVLPGAVDLSVGSAATSGGLSADHDPALDVDSAVAVTTPAAGTASVYGVQPYSTGAGDAGLNDDLGGVLDTVTNAPSVVEPAGSGLLDVPGVHEATSSIGSLIQPDLGSVTSIDAVDGLGGTVTGTVSGAGDTLHGVTGLLGRGDDAPEQPAHGEVFGIL